jgi:homoserine kinase
MPLTTFGPVERPLDLPAGDRLIISVPASAANLGPAMDGLGMSVGLRLTVAVGADPAPTPATATLEGTAYLRDLLASAGVAIAEWATVTSNDIPVERGLGGSGAIRLAALLAAAAIRGDEPDTARLLSDAGALEGHPDNVAASLCGGVVASANGSDGRVHHVELGALDGLVLALAIPNHRVSTVQARGVLPDAVLHRDARFTASHVALLVAAIAERRFDLLDEATRDRLHQPHRLALIPGGAEALDAARGHGALGAFLSGSGSTLAAFAAPERAAAVAGAMVEQLEEHGTPAEQRVVVLDGEGATVAAAGEGGPETWGWRWRASERTRRTQAD